MHVGEVVGASKKQARHRFIKLGGVETWGLHFFEQPDAEVFAFPRRSNGTLLSAAL